MTKKRKAGPVCFWCKRRPARERFEFFFCSTACAVAEGLAHMPYKFDWCQPCFDAGHDDGNGPGWREAGHEHS